MVEMWLGNVRDKYQIARGCWKGWTHMKITKMKEKKPNKPRFSFSL